MTKRRARALAASVALGALALGAPVALAQSVGDFQLRPGTPTPTPRPAGPVDSDVPSVGPRPAPAPAPSPTAQRPAPTPSIAASPVTAPPPTLDRPAPLSPGQRQLPPRVIQQQPQGAAPPGTAPALPQGAPPSSAGPNQAAPPPTIGPVPSYPSLVESGQGFDPLAFLRANWPWLAGLLGALLAGWLGRIWMRNREEREPVIEFERPVVQSPAPAPSPVAAEPAPAPPPQPVVEPEAVLESTGPLGIDVQALRLSATLLNTTLNYSLLLTNRSRKKLGPVTVSGDMIAAHAKTPVEQQLGLDGALLERRHELPGLAPGESTTLKGEIRLPLAMITPIKAGDAALFIPLARFQVEAAQAKGDPLFLARTFVVGEAPDTANAGLRPFRLDLGPRVYSRIAQREVLATA